MFIIFNQSKFSSGPVLHIDGIFTASSNSIYISSGRHNNLLWFDRPLRVGYHPFPHQALMVIFFFSFFSHTFQWFGGSYPNPPPLWLFHHLKSTIFICVPSLILFWYLFMLQIVLKNSAIGWSPDKFSYSKQTEIHTDK